MVKKQQENTNLNKLQIWKVIGVFAFVFAAVQLAVVVFGVGINYLMRLINASENLRVFVGTTISRTGMITAILLISIPAIRAILNPPILNSIYPPTKYWWKDLLVGFGISAVAMIIIFLIEIIFGWISVSGFSLEGAPWDN